MWKSHHLLFVLRLSTSLATHREIAHPPVSPFSVRFRLVSNQLTIPSRSRILVLTWQGRFFLSQPRAVFGTTTTIRKQRRLAWPLHKDDTLSRSGRSTDLNIYFS